MKKMKRKIAMIKRKIKKAPLSSYVVFSISMVLIFTLVVTILTATTGQDYGTIYTVFVVCFGGEILCVSLIKIFKLKEEDNDYEREINQ